MIEAKATATRPVALTIAGSDSSGGAGVQADLRTFSRLGVFGTTAITALTAQNLDGVRDVHPVPLSHVRAQAAAVLDGFPTVAAAKTGMLWSAGVVELVAGLCRAGRVRWWVVDPVMVATSGALLLERDAVRAYRETLLPAASLVTPNLDEAAVLLDRGPIARAEMEAAARELAARCGCAVLLKGGHLEGDPLDLLVDGDRTRRWERPRIAGVNTHGSGCMLAAAIAALLARGRALPDACKGALDFVHEAMRRPHDVAGVARLAGIEG